MEKKITDAFQTARTSNERGLEQKKKHKMKFYYNVVNNFYLIFRNFDKTQFHVAI